MWDRLIGALGVVWGGFVLASTWSGGGHEPSGDFTIGQLAEMALAMVFVVVGFFYLLRPAAKK